MGAQLVLVYCLLTNAHSCVEKRPVMALEQPGLMGCMVAAQPMAAGFLNEHPQYRLRDFRCEIGKRPEKAI